MHSNAELKINKPSALGTWTKYELWVTNEMMSYFPSSSSPTAEQQLKMEYPLSITSPLKGTEWILIRSGGAGVEWLALHTVVFNGIKRL